jgi:hypothetical protein
VPRGKKSTRRLVVFSNHYLVATARRLAARVPAVQTRKQLLQRTFAAGSGLAASGSSFAARGGLAARGWLARGGLARSSFDNRLAAHGLSFAAGSGFAASGLAVQRLQLATQVAENAGFGRIGGNHGDQGNSHHDTQTQRVLHRTSNSSQSGKPIATSRTTNAAKWQQANLASKLLNLRRLCRLPGLGNLRRPSRKPNSSPAVVNGPHAQRPAWGLACHLLTQHRRSAAIAAGADAVSHKLFLRND